MTPAIALLALSESAALRSTVFGQPSQPGINRSSVNVYFTAYFVIFSLRCHFVLGNTEILISILISRLLSSIPYRILAGCEFSKSHYSNTCTCLGTILTATYCTRTGSCTMLSALPTPNNILLAFFNWSRYLGMPVLHCAALHSSDSFHMSEVSVYHDSMQHAMYLIFSFFLTGCTGQAVQPEVCSFWIVCL